jgi:hypothetical protein
MVYYRSWWSYYVCGLLSGVFQRQFFKQGNLHHVVQKSTDGAIARYYTQREWRQITSGLFRLGALQVYGLKNEVIPIPHSPTKQFLENLVPDGVVRILTQHLRGGSFLVAHMHKIDVEDASMSADASISC